MNAYLVFLAEAVTLAVIVVAVVVAVAAGVAGVVAGAGRRTRDRPRLEVEDLGRRYDRLRLALDGQLLPRKALRREMRAERKRHQAAAEQRATGTPRPRVFVLDFVGDLRASAAAGLREEVTAVLATARAGDEVVVRLENPGGVVQDQGFAASQLQRVRDAEVTLTVAVDKVAASGGYLMACVADRIVAAPFAVVGSIGVIAQVPSVYRFLDRFGLAVEQYKGGEYKRTVTPFGEPTEEERAKFTAEIADTHALFREFVATHRPQLDIDAVATGEAWYGTRALDRGLVDQLATSDDYLLAARSRADVVRVRYRPPATARGRMRPRLAGLLESLVDPRP